MKLGPWKDIGPPRKVPSDTCAWLDRVISKGPEIMTPLPCVYLKCTSMIMNTMNFSIDYSAPAIPTALKNSYKTLVTQQLLSPSHQRLSKSGYQVSQSGCDSNNKINPQTLNKQSNVKMTLQYLGTGFCVTKEVIRPKDELSLFQQICGGESICVFKGYLCPGETFQIISRRHYGYPFSASIYINGLVAARISWCCEYRYRLGLQQGRRGCFRVIQLSGGKPCDRCAERQSQNKHQTTAGRDRTEGRPCDGSITSQEKEKTMGAMQVTTWSTHSVYVAPPSAQPPARRWKRVKKKAAPQEETDSEQENKLHNRYQRARKPRLRAIPDSRKGCKAPQLRQYKDDEGKPPAVDEWKMLAETSVSSEAIPVHKGQEDPYSPLSGKASPAQAQCPGNASLCAEEYDAAQSIHRKLAMALREGTWHSDVELSDSSDSSKSRSITDANWSAVTCSSDVSPSSPLPVSEQQVAAEDQKQDDKMEDGDSHRTEVEEAGEDDLLCQITDLTAVLQECDEVEQLVLRNTGMTDVLLQHLAPAITCSRSELESINLNLNDIGPGGAETLVHLVREKPSIKSLLLYGNQLGDEGVRTLMRGLSELLRKDGHASHDASCSQLSELDIGGNQLGSEGLRSVAAFLQLNPPLKHLGLAHSCGEACDAWPELCDAVKMNANLTHLLLDENHLGDAGAGLIADVIQVNQRLVSIDLDSNDIGEEGGRAIAGSLASSTDSALTDISLDNNSISTETRETIVRLLTLK